MSDEIVVRPLRESDLPETERVRRVAFGTLFGLAKPEEFGGDSRVARSRWLIEPEGAFAAERGGALVGSNFAVRWGSVGFFGPLSVRPDLWDGGVGQRLAGAAVDLLDRWGVRLVGLFTFPESPKHVATYQKLGFRPRFLTALLSRPVAPSPRSPAASLYSERPPADREALLAAGRELTGSLYDGLDVTREVAAADAFGLGDTVFVEEGSRLAGMAVCHLGPGTEAGTGTCYVKFGAARDGPGAEERFAALLAACESLGGARGAVRLVLGVNTARREAYGKLLGSGFQIARLGVAMHRPDEPGTSRPGVWCLDDWR